MIVSSIHKVESVLDSWTAWRATHCEGEEKRIPTIWRLPPIECNVKPHRINPNARNSEDHRDSCLVRIAKVVIASTSPCSQHCLNPSEFVSGQDNRVDVVNLNLSDCQLTDLSFNNERLEIGP